jgi:flagellar motor switch/type III secretory pathway protein FliN
MTCDKCNQSFGKVDEVLHCSGSCGKKFHVACTSVGRTLYQSIKLNLNLRFFCDGCVNFMNNFGAKIDLIYEHLLKNDERIGEQSVKLNEINNGIASFQVKSNAGEKKETYAEKLKLGKNEPVIVIKPKDSNQKGKDTRMDVQKKIDPSKVPIKELRNVAKGSVVIECRNADATEIVRKEVEEKMGANYDISVAALRNPEIKVLGLYDKPDGTEVIERIKSQNEYIDKNASIEFLHAEESKTRKNYHSLILRVDPTTYNLIMEVGKINVGWSRCRVVENVRILRCFKCAEYGHKIDDCKNQEKCFKCTGNHRSKDCESSFYKCVNCEKAKNTFNLSDIKIDHPVWSSECQVYNRILQKKKKTINYYG